MAFKRRLKFDKRIKYKKRMDRLFILVIVCFIFLGIGYSYISTDLNINGTANVNSANWDVHFANLSITEGSVETDTLPTITDPTTVEFAVTLEEPGDYYEFAVDAVNQGTIDAMIDSIDIQPNLTEEQTNYLFYTVSTDDGLLLKPKQILPAGTTRKIYVVFFYLPGFDTQIYPTEDQVFNVEVSINYTQADSSAIETSRYIYSIHVSSKGELLESTNDYFDSSQALFDSLIDSYGQSSNAFFRYGVGDTVFDDDAICELSIGFIYNENMYYLIGGHSNLLDIFGFGEKSIYYEKNKETLLNAFGNDNCMYDNEGITCLAPDTILTISANVEGDVSVTVEGRNEFIIASSNNTLFSGCLGTC